MNLKGDAAQLLDPGLAPAGGDASPAAAAPAAAAEAWNEEQELALVKALKAVGKDVDDRWGQVRGGSGICGWRGNHAAAHERCCLGTP